MAVKKKVSGRGGYRPGAGQKKKTKFFVNGLNVSLDQDSIDKLGGEEKAEKYLTSKLK